jgi:uracil-DNA glycosylase
MKRSYVNKCREFVGDWGPILSPQFSNVYMWRLSHFISDRRKNITVYPEKTDTFKAFKLTPPDKVLVVILGQDPYIHGEAHGLSFGLKQGVVKIPPSLRIILDEVNKDVYSGEKTSFDTSLESWATQGVLLLNTILTVEDGKSLSHAGYGWEKFTVSVIEALAKMDKPLVIMLWGGHAKKYSIYFTNSKHHILQASHPAAELHRRGAGFTGCKHFSTCNDILLEQSLPTIVW